MRRCKRGTNINIENGIRNTSVRHQRAIISSGGGGGDVTAWATDADFGVATWRISVATQLVAHVGK
jgi:hypothetical protein